MRLLGLVVLIAVLALSCKTENERKPDGEDNKYLSIKYSFEDNRDTVALGDTVGFAMTLYDTQFDSLSVFLGHLDSLILLDTTAILSVQNRSASFWFVPNKLGPNRIEGLVKEFDVGDDETVVKSTPFYFDFFVVRPYGYRI
ncbi:MAG: hypothetical protein RIG68_19720 [Imperialibacter sp.]|uniref:hypothetical protein n=1 Tax=Imperialibacter sp. TaxID=2038411 RepID=UPI0032EEA320